MSSVKQPHRFPKIAILLSLLLALSLAGRTALAQEPVVRLFFFYSQECSHCLAVMEDVLPALQAKYGDQLEMRLFEISELHNYEVLLGLEKRYDVTRVGIPEVFIGHDFLLGEEEIRTRLDGLIQEYLAAGGVDFPSQDLPVPVPSAPELSTQRPSVYLAYFFKSGCRECDRVSYELDHLQTEYPSLVIESFDLGGKAALNEALGERYGVPLAKRLTAPAIFIGDDYLVGDQVNLDNLRALVKKYSQEGTTPVWEGLETSQAEDAVVARFRSFGILTVLGAGLIDGLNPCAFTTIVFFISYLAFLERRRGEILLTGLTFTAGVFVAYLLAGVGALKFILSLGIVSALGQSIYLLVALLCLVLAGLSLHDFYQAQRGRLEEIRLRLPRALQRRVHQAIRQSGGLRGYALAAFGTGLVVSLLELACTGQVYLPTITFVIGIPQLRANALAYLLLYNLMFIVPLVVVFGLAFFGTTSQRLGLFVQKRIGIIKLAMAVLFLLLAAWLIYAFI